MATNNSDIILNLLLNIKDLSKRMKELTSVNEQFELMVKYVRIISSIAVKAGVSMDGLSNKFREMMVTAGMSADKIEKVISGLEKNTLTDKDLLRGLKIPISGKTEYRGNFPYDKNQVEQFLLNVLDGLIADFQPKIDGVENKATNSVEQMVENISAPLAKGKPVSLISAILDVGQTFNDITKLETAEERIKKLAETIGTVSEYTGKPPIAVAQRVAGGFDRKEINAALASLGESGRVLEKSTSKAAENLVGGAKKASLSLSQGVGETTEEYVQRILKMSHDIGKQERDVLAERERYARSMVGDVNAAIKKESDKRQRSLLEETEAQKKAIDNAKDVEKALHDGQIEFKRRQEDIRQAANVVLRVEQARLDILKKQTREAEKQSKINAKSKQYTPSAINPMSLSKQKPTTSSFSLDINLMKKMNTETVEASEKVDEYWNKQTEGQQRSLANMDKIWKMAQAENVAFDKQDKIQQLLSQRPVDQANGFAKLAIEAEKAGIATDDFINALRNKGISEDTLHQAKRRVGELKDGLGGTIKRIFDLRSAVSMAFGTFSAMAIFSVMQAFSNTISAVIEKIKETHKAIHDLSTAEELLSNQGIEVTGQDMIDIVDELAAKYKLLEKTDISAGLGEMSKRLATTGLSLKQIVSLYETALLISTEYGTSLDQAVDTVSRSILTGEAESIQNYGYEISAKIVENEAKRLGLLKDGKSELTDQEAIMVRASTLSQQRLERETAVLRKQDELSNASALLNKNWQEFIALFAENEMVKQWNEITYILAKDIEALNYIIQLISKQIEPTNEVEKAFLRVLDVLKKIFRINTAIVTGGMSELVPYLLDLAYKSGTGLDPNNQGTKESLEKQDTKTGTPPIIPPNVPPINPPSNTLDDYAKKIKSTLINLAEALDELGDDARNAVENYNNAIEEMNNAHLLDLARELEDYKHKLIQLTSNTNDEIAKENQDYQNEEINRYAKFLEELRQLREKYLMDLDDALRDRDARKILTLGREYQTDKTNMTNEYNLESDTRAREHEAKLEQARKERDDRIAELEYEHEITVERMKKDYEIKRELAKQEHEIDMRRRSEERDDRIREIANEMAEQLGLSETGSRAIYDALMEYFGSNGAISDLTRATYTSATADMSKLYKRMLEYAIKYKQIAQDIQKTVMRINGSNSFSANENVSGAYSDNDNKSTTPKSGIDSGRDSVYGMADGGLIIAKRPTHIIMGEAGQEAGMFLPVNKAIQFTEMFRTGEKKVGGNVSIVLSLSPDLRTDIINSTLDGISVTIDEIARTR